MPEKQAKPISSRPVLVLAYVVLAIGTIVSLTPLYWLVVTSLRPEGADFTYPPQWIPDTLHFENYAVAWRRAPFWVFTRNSILVTFSAIAGSLFSSSLAAYAFARLRFPGRDILFALMISTMMLPGIVTLIPRFLLFQKLHLIDSLWPLIIPSWFGTSAFYIFLLRQFILTLPIEMEEAALVDGASRVRIFTLVAMSLCKPALASVAIFSFIRYWNDFMGPLIFTNHEEVRTLALGLRYFGSEGRTEFRLVMAVAVIMILPVLIVFFAAEKHFVSGVALSGLAGR